MKQVLFILLAFISFQGFSQETVKLKGIGLEVMTKDLGQMNWEEAKKACADLGDGWRLPTIDELKDMYQYRNKKKCGFKYSNYWSGTEYSNTHSWCSSFINGLALPGGAYYNNKNMTLGVCAVRTLK